MLYGVLADLVVFLHGAFILFVVGGGVLVFRWRWLAWLHIPAALWGATIEFTGWICPLTPLENHFRRLAGEAGYSGSFIAHYVVPLVYPEGLTQRGQLLLGFVVVGLNLVIYWAVWRRRRKSR